MAPELTQESKKGYMGPPVDMWAFGCLIFEMLHNRVAFNAVSEQQLHMRIRSATHAAFRKEVSKDAKALIKGLLQPDPKDRLTSTTAADLPFFRKDLESMREHLEMTSRAMNRGELTPAKP